MEFAFPPRTGRSRVGVRVNRSWTVTREAIDAKAYDLKAVNTTAKAGGDTRTPEELFDIMEAKGTEVAETLVALQPG